MACSLASYDKVYKRYEALLRGHHKSTASPNKAQEGRTSGDGALETDDDTGSLRTGLALFGLGRIGVIHLQNILSLYSRGVELLYCVDGNAQRRELLKNTLLSETQVIMLDSKDEDQVFADPRVQAVIIGTPTPTHEDLVLKALNSGKAVLCEKPVALEYDSIKRCYEAAGTLPLFCAFSRRFDPSFRSLRQKVRNGEVGQIHVVKSCSRDSPRPSTEYLKISGGIFHDCAVHDLDVVCWILEERPISIFAQAHAFEEDIQELDDHDTAAITLKFPSGALAIIDLSRNAESYGYDQRLEVFGSDGMMKAGDVCPTSVSLHNNTGINKSPICYSFSSRYIQAYKDELIHFLHCFHKKADLEVRATETLAVCRMAAACEESARTGAVVHMDWDKK